MALSFQLPDLLNLSRSFELRTNRYCRLVTLASENWLLGLKTADHHHLLTESEQSTLHSTKLGLLAALCFPTCDATPLRLLTDFLSFLILADGRLRSACDLSDMGWWEDDTRLKDTGLDCLGNHELFR